MVLHGGWVCLECLCCSDGRCEGLEAIVASRCSYGIFMYFSTRIGIGFMVHGPEEITKIIVISSLSKPKKNWYMIHRSLESLNSTSL